MKHILCAHGSMPKLHFTRICQVLPPGQGTPGGDGSRGTKSPPWSLSLPLLTRWWAKSGGGTLCASQELRSVVPPQPLCSRILYTGVAACASLCRRRSVGRCLPDVGGLACAGRPDTVPRGRSCHRGRRPVACGGGPAACAALNWCHAESLIGPCRE